MSERKCSPEDYIQFLIASPGRFSCAEAGRVQQQTAGGPAHDAYYRLLTELEPDPQALWREAQGQVDAALAIWAGIPAGSSRFPNATIRRAPFFGVVSGEGFPSIHSRSRRRSSGHRRLGCPHQASS